MAKFTYNNALSATIKESSFFANKGYYSQLQIQTDLENLSKTLRPYLAKLKIVHEELKRNIAVAQNYYQGLADSKQSPVPEIQIRDFVFILAKFIWTTHLFKKLSKKFLGPFKIIGKPSFYSYQVKLPVHLRLIYLVFHISQLEPALSSSIKSHHNPFPCHILEI